MAGHLAVCKPNASLQVAFVASVVSYARKMFTGPSVIKLLTSVIFVPFQLCGYGKEPTLLTWVGSSLIRKH